jgi:DNA-binding transcriptional ArsR family regulator
MTILATLQAMGDPTRFQILRLVRHRELAAGEIARHFDLTRPAISQHVHILRRAGLLNERRRGRKRLYIVRPEGLTPLRAFLEGFWEDRLQRLKQAAEAIEGRRKSP